MNNDNYITKDDIELNNELINDNVSNEINEELENRELDEIEECVKDGDTVRVVGEDGKEESRKILDFRETDCDGLNSFNLKYEYKVGDKKNEEPAFVDLNSAIALINR